jgi:hypothetical protein
MADRLAKALQTLAIERQWLEEHGSTEAGYVARYGSRQDPGHYGSGGEAIYAADLKAVQRAEAIVDRLLAQAAKRAEQASA